MQKTVAATLCVIMATTGGASAGGFGREIARQAPVVYGTSPTEHVDQLRTGTTIFVERFDGSGFVGRLEEVTSGAIIVRAKRSGRLVEVPFREIQRVTVPKAKTGRRWTPWAIGKSIGNGIRAGVSAIVMPFVVVIVLASVWEE